MHLRFDKQFIPMLMVDLTGNVFAKKTQIPNNDSSLFVLIIEHYMAGRKQQNVTKHIHVIMYTT